MPTRTVIVPLGTVAREIVQQVALGIKEAFGLTVERGPIQQKPTYAFNKDRHQYHSTAILRRLAQLKAGAENLPVIGLAEIDLFVPDAPFLYGEADRDALSAVVGLTRLHEEHAGRTADPERLKRRAQVEAVHEVGHLLGLSHCDDVRCVMFFSQTLADSDRKGPGLCASCRAAITA
jgi:archaemetzincin